MKMYRAAAAWGVLLVAMLWTAALAAAAETRIDFQVELPDGVESGTLVWGVMRQGVEIGCGEIDLTGERSAARTKKPRADEPVRVTTFTAAVDGALRQGGPPVTVRLCINTDDLVSYIPSVGDLFQATTLRHSARGWRAQVAADGWRRRAAAGPESVLTVRYHRIDANYSNVSLWTWAEKLTRAPKENELYPVGRDAFGLVFQIDTALYGEPDEGIGLLPRRNADWQHKDGGDRMWFPSMGKSVYLVQEDDTLYREVPDVSPKVRRVTLDADHHLTVRFSHRLPVTDWSPDKFKVLTGGETLTVQAVYPFKHRGDRCATYSIETAERFEFPQKAYALEVAGFGTHNVQVGHLVKDPSRFYDADARLGARYTPQVTTFRVFAPGALTAVVVVADHAEGGEGVREHDMIAGEKGLWAVSVAGDLAGKYYAYKLGGIGFNAEEEITDIYATCTQAHHTRSLIVDLSRTDPPGFREHHYQGPMSPVDAVIYEMHVRDFTIAANSGVTRKGKYLGLAEPGTTLPGDPAISTGIDHLVELGVTHVQLMPVQDFDNGKEEGDSYDWGYMPVHFDSPDGWYALDPRGAGKIRELKAAIKAFHERGIGVIMDVVYNHAAARAPFEKLVPGYYFRTTAAGNYSNGSGCGNEFASENPMARKFLLDSVRFWAKEYMVDGFRFDLMGLIDLETLKKVKDELSTLHPGILIYGEPWTGGPTPLRPVTDKHHTSGTGIGAFNDHFRDAIKGDRDGGAPGFIQVGDRVDGVVKGLMGGIHDWSHDPSDSVNYFEAHDNLTTQDKLLQSAPEASDEERRRMMRFAALTLFTSQGAIFMHSGQEMCRTKKGSHNSYNLPDEINRIDWDLKKTNADVVEYHKGLIALRKAHPAFRLRTRAEVEQRVSFLTPPDHHGIIYSIDARGVDGESADRLLVLLNGATGPTTFALPGGDWTIHANADQAGTEQLGRASESIALPAHSGMVLAQ